MAKILFFSPQARNLRLGGLQKGKQRFNVKFSNGVLAVDPDVADILRKDPRCNKDFFEAGKERKTRVPAPAPAAAGAGADENEAQE
jgi:hypothetical protein